MAYGTIKVDNIIFTNGGSDQTVTVSGIVASTSGNLTVTGTISGGTVKGTYGSFTSLTGVTTSGTTANFVTLSGTTITGGTINAITTNITTGIFAAGSAAAPSLTFTGDLNTGIFSPGSDSLSIVTNATRSITITAAQAVGIQTANPSAPLHVAGTVRVGADDATDATIEIGAGATGNRNTFIDLVGDTTYVDYGLRFIRNNTGANTTSEIRHRGTGELNIITQEAASIVFGTNNTERARIDSSGRLLVGTSSTRGNFFNAGGIDHLLQLETSNYYAQSLVSNGGTTAAGAAILTLARSRGTTAGSYTAVSSGDSLGRLSFQGADGVYFIGAAEISAEVDGTPNEDDMPGRLVFSTTADGAASPTEAFRITNDRVIAYNQPTPTSKSAAATLTITELKTGIIQYTGAVATLTLPTGTLMEGGFAGIYTNMAFEWSVINTGSGICTVAAGADHTVVGSGAVATSASARFVSRRTAANTFVSYRVS
jgi:hypothetical protein